MEIEASGASPKGLLNLPRGWDGGGKGKQPAAYAWVIADRYEKARSDCYAILARKARLLRVAWFAAVLGTLSVFAGVVILAFSK